MCNDGVLYCTVLQCVMVVCLLYGTAICNGGVFYCTVLQCVKMVCFIVL